MDTVTRRRLLAASSAALVAGCLDRTAPAADPSNGTGSDDGSSAPTQLDDSAPESCPGYGDRVDRVICYAEIDPDADELFLEPSEDRVSAGESIAFTLANGTDERLASNFYNWRVDKYVGDEWHRVAPMGYNEPLMHLEPGERHTWTVTIGTEVPDDGRWRGDGGGTEALALSGVGAGHYAFRARGWFEGREETLAFAATFELEGERLELTPSNAIEGTEWEGDTLVARSSRGDPDDEGNRLGAFDLERVEGASDGDEPRTVITEQLVRLPQLRDAVAIAIEHDADRVRLEEYDGTYPIFGSRSEGVYEYRGEYYRVSTRELEA